MVKSRTSAPLQAVEQKQEADLRAWGNWLDTWHVCANKACHWARCCRGKPSGCFNENFSRLPDRVQDLLAMLAMAREEGIPFDEAWAELTRCGLVAELAKWHELAHGSEASSAVN